MSSLPHRSSGDQTLAAHPLPAEDPAPPLVREPRPFRAPRPVVVAVLSSAPAYGIGARLWRMVAFREVLHVDEEKGLLALLEERPVDVVVLDPAYGRGRFLDSLKRTRPAVRLLFLVDEPRPPRLLKLRGRGHPFVCLARQAAPSRLARQLLETLFPRGEARKRVSGLTLRVDGTAYELENVSPHGLAWRVEEGDLTDALSPGRVLRGLTVHRGERLLLSVAHARVRHLTAVEPDGRRGRSYRVGVRLLPAVEDPASVGEERRFDDPITVSALLKQALARGELQFTDAHGGEPIHLGRWDAAEDPLAGCHPFIGEWPEGWREGSVLRGCFELNNWGCEFLSTVVARPDSRTLMLRAPDVLKGIRRREIPRHRPSERSALRVRFHLPFAEREVDCRPWDFTVRGFAFELDEALGPVVPGSRLEVISVEGIEATPVSCRGVVRHVRVVLHEGRRRYRCGVALDGLGESGGLLAVDAVVNDRLAAVKSGQGMRLDDLWTFFYASNFIYPKKEEAMRPILREVKANYAVLLEEKASPLMRTVVVNSPEQPVEAHMSLLRAYSETWIMQHLASVGMQTKNRNAVRDAYLGTVATLSQLDGIRWMRAYFQPSKSFPDRIAGVFARRIEDHERSNLNRYAYLSSPTEFHGNAGVGLSVREAIGDDLPLIEGYFASENSLTEFRADDGTLGEMGLRSVGGYFSRYGLHRRRRLVVAEANGLVLGVAFMEFSSYGLNLSEVTNRCTIHAWAWEPHTVAALAEYARGVYRDLGYPFCVVMVAPKFADSLVSRGFSYSRDYACWTLHRDLFPEYADYIEKAFTTQI